MQSLNNAPAQSPVQTDYYSRHSTNEDTLLERFSTWAKKLDSHYSEWTSEAEECFDMVAGHQWSSDEKTQLEEKLRVPVTFNRMQPTIDAVVGAEIQSREQVQYFPREVGDTAVSEILTQGATYEMGECNGNEEDSDAFRDCLICGVGVTETRVESDDGSTAIIRERVDPIEIKFDPGRAKACFSDARFLRREKTMSADEFSELWPDATPTGSDTTGKRTTIVDPRLRYTNGMLGDDGQTPGEVTVCEWQWYEVEKYILGAVPTENGEREVREIPHEEFEAMLALDPNVEHVPQTRKVFYRAFTNNDVVLEIDPIKVNDFTYKAITGKRDRNKGTFYGLVRPMKDPQKFANKFFSQILHIINSNAKGGVAVELGAVEDIRNFEDSWAQSDAITYFKDGAISGNRMMPKTPPPYPQGSDRLMSLSVDAIRDVTGVNQEMLGLADREQAGILEQQRKQAAYGILAAFFDARHRYAKLSGKLLLKFIQEYIPADKLVRIVGEDGLPQYVPMALAQSTAEYDIIVDEAPSSPNQKLQTFQVLTQIMPMLSNADLPDSFWAELVKYSPLPAALSLKLAQSILQSAEEQAQAAAPGQALEQRGAEAEVALTEADAALKTAEAQVKVGTLPTDDAKAASEARLNQARIAEIQNRLVNDLQARTSTQDQL